MIVRWLMMIVVVIALTSAHSAASAAVTPTNFTDEAVVDVPTPTALAFLPDGRMLVASQQGQLYLYGDDLDAVLDLSDVICSGDTERGLLGVAVDPRFTTNRFIFVYYTANRFGCDEGYPRSPVNRVARFVLSEGGMVERASETVLVDNIPSPAGNHNGGDVKFGRDDFLYISIGDGGCDYAGDSGCGGANDAARDDHVLLGKILRITRDGGIPADNPFLGDDSVRCNQTGITEPGNHCQETWATGLRNPYRIAFDQNPGGSRLYINDVGQGKREEIDVGIAGADYGWNMREGACERDRDTNCGPPPSELTDPLVDYGHGTGCRSITGGAFAPYGWPVPYHRSYFFGDFICGKIFWIATDKQEKPRIEEFATDVGRIVAMEVGPVDEGRQGLYYTTYSNDGEVRRITYNGTLLNEVQVQLPLVFR